MHDLIRKILKESKENVDDFFKPKNLKSREEKFNIDFHKAIKNKDIQKCGEYLEAVFELENEDIKQYWINLLIDNHLLIKTIQETNPYDCIDIIREEGWESIARKEGFDIEDDELLNETEDIVSQIATAEQAKKSENHIYDPSKIYDDFYSKENTNEKSHEVWLTP